MQFLKFTCEVITPLFLSGANGETPELRAPSVKGAMRYWWRAMHANLPMAEMRKRESALFGGADPGRRSQVLIRIPDAIERRRVAPVPLVPHKEFMRKDAIEPGEQFTVQLTLMADKPLYEGSKLSPLEQLERHFILTCLLGGIGKRVRRGMGSVGIISIQRGEGTPTTYQISATLEGIYDLISSLAPNCFQRGNSFIYCKFEGAGNYPYIKEIHLGRADKEALLHISKVTHKFKTENGRAYESSLGHASKGERFASPVYVSIVGSSSELYPIITRLNTQPGPVYRNGINMELQSRFINAIKQ